MTIDLTSNRAHWAVAVLALGAWATAIIMLATEESAAPVQCTVTEDISLEMKR